MRALAAIALIACNSSPAAPLCSDPASPHVRPPAKPDAPAASNTDTITFAIDSVLLGDSRRGETTTSAVAWEVLGFDLDGHETKSCSSTEVCRGAFAILDGPGGIDNSFGANIFPLLFLGEDHPSVIMSKIIREGAFTLQLRVRGLDPTIAQTATDLSVDSFPSQTFDTTGAYPSFAANEDWPVRADFLVDGKTLGSGAIEHFTAHIVNGTLVVTGAQLTLGIVWSGTAIDIPLHAAVITMDVHGDYADNGTIAGVVAPEVFDDVFSTFNRCNSVFTGFASRAVDILIDGTNKPGVACNAISFGIGFTAKRIANPTRVARPIEPGCHAADAGLDAPDDG